MSGRIARIPITWLMLTHRKWRLFLSILGIAFAVLLMFMQLGFLTGLFDSQTLIIRALDADIVITSTARNNFHLEELFPRQRMLRARDVAGVASTTDILVDSTVWRSPTDGRNQIIRLIGIDVENPGIRHEEINALATRLREPGTVLFDTGSRSFFGNPDVGELVELSHQSVKVVGRVDLGADFRNDGSVFTSQETFRRLLPYTPADRTAIGLVKLAPDANIGDVLAELRSVLLDDVSIATRSEFEDLEKSYWSKMTPTGFIFTLGLVVGFIIGVMICYQILYNEINDHIPQFATLKAVGFPDRYLVGIVVTEALLLAALGLVPAIIVSQLFYSLMVELVGLQMIMTVPRIILVAALTVLMCLVSAFLAVARVLRTDPAEVF